MHDERMLDTSGLYVDLAKFAFSPAEQEMCIYGDLAYPLRTTFAECLNVSLLQCDC